VVCCGTSFVEPKNATFVYQGLLKGFDLGLDTSQLKGRRIHRNYTSAIEGRREVTKAIQKRVSKGKTVDLGVWTSNGSHSIPFEDYTIFPMGAVAKYLDGVKLDEVRCTSDHTASGTNPATNMAFLRHHVHSYAELAMNFLKGFWLRVTDVDGAFPSLPLAVHIWPYFMFRFFPSDGSDFQHLYVHVCGDFGARGLPGTFKIFMVDVVCQMARCAGKLTLPLAIHVDDLGLCAPTEAWANDEMAGFQAWVEDTTGVHFKVSKDKPAAQRQLMIGFWWDSTNLTRP